MRDCLLFVDVFDDFEHEDGQALLASFEARVDGVVALLDAARAAGIPVVYANDSKGIFDGDARGIVERAQRGPGRAHPLLSCRATTTASSSSRATRHSTRRPSS